MTQRIKVRSCIRENTFRYWIDPSEFPQVWAELQNSFGHATEFGFPNLQQIDATPFLLRSSISDASITVICKEVCALDDLRQFHQIVGFH